MNTHRPPSVVREGRGTHVFLWTVFPLLGAGIGWTLSQVPGWLARVPVWVHQLPLVPGEEQTALLARLDGPVLTAVLVVLGILAGGFVALSSYDDMTAVEVAGDGVRVTRSGTTTAFERARVDAAFMDGRELVLLGPDTAELTRERTDHGGERLRAAFEAHGYPWYDGDPHRDEFQRWVDGMPGLEQHSQALLRARQDALKAGDADDGAELREELARLGVVVREEGGRQYWRPVRNGSPSEG
ncbi:MULTISPECIES: YqeB family protein [Nocardiopsis]|uniref:DUF308 domain-containing protein n=1 Tax=Nocardiopsis sinuspersici TaxID=501010 RepID=A0A1V3BY89_9ACTN|nr:MULTISPECIES: hypothetical protein [Nocardiopsis]OOC53517.1 hypothetical protein NOSIN_06615 [Nocardiopsis sinuspersici]